jgi:hypothetical protein
VALHALPLENPPPSPGVAALPNEFNAVVSFQPLETRKEVRCFRFQFWSSRLSTR